MSSLKPEVKQTLLLRVSAAQAYDALANPDITTRFWFSHSDGPLTPGDERTWEWRMYGVSTRVRVLEAIPGERLVVEWGDEKARSTVEWTFDNRGGNATLVTVRNFDFKGDLEQTVKEALDSMGGFSLVLAAAKAWLEHGIELNVVLDHAPDALDKKYLTGA